MSFPGYMKGLALEFVLVLACSWALSVVVMEGFWVDSGLRFGPVPVAVEALVLVAYYYAAWMRNRIYIGVGVVLVVVAGVVSVSMAMSTGQNVYDDVAENYLVAALCMVLSVSACFLLTRTLAGSAVSFIAVVVACALIQAFYEQGLLGYSLVAFLSALALVVWRNCMLSQLRADVLQRVSQPANFAFSVLPVLLCAGLALVVWFAFIAPLNPGILRLELIRDPRVADTVQVKGVGDARMEVDTSTTSDNLTDGEMFTTDKLKVDPLSYKEVPARSVPEEALQDADADQSGGSSSGNRETLNQASTERQYDAVSYSLAPVIAILLVVLALLLVAAIIAYFILRRRHRIKRLEGFLAGRTGSEQVRSIYLFLLPKMGRIGFSVPNGATLSSWSEASARNMEGLRDETKVPFDVLTKTYVRCAYGCYEPSEDEVVPFVAFYEGFWKAARVHLGNLKYFFKSFRLG